METRPCRLREFHVLSKGPCRQHPSLTRLALDTLASPVESLRRHGAL